MNVTPAELLTAGIAAVTAITWLVRLEGRINALKAEAEALRVDLIAVKAKAEAEAAAHSETTLALVRVQEQLKHLTSLFERQFITPSPRRTRASE